MNDEPPDPEEIARKRRESRSVIDQLHPGNRLRLMFGLSLLLQDPPWPPIESLNLPPSIWGDVQSRYIQSTRTNDMKQIQEDIKQFMQAAEQGCPETPTISIPEVRKLRAHLILEEALEQCKALGVKVCFDDQSEGQVKTIYGLDQLILGANEEPNLTEIADGIADQVYASVGTAIALGIDMAPIWDLVQTSNMAKFGPGSYKNEHGKQMKPPGWVAPNAAIAQEIERQKNS